MLTIPEASVATKYRVVQVKGAKPETFIVLGIDFEAGTITGSSEAMQEAQLRTYLKKSGASEKDISSWIEQGRHYPA